MPWICSKENINVNTGPCQLIFNGVMALWQAGMESNWGEGASSGFSDPLLYLHINREALWCSVATWHSLDWSSGETPTLAQIPWALLPLSQVRTFSKLKLIWLELHLENVYLLYTAFWEGKEIHSKNLRQERQKNIRPCQMTLFSI